MKTQSLRGLLPSAALFGASTMLGACATVPDNFLCFDGSCSDNSSGPGPAPSPSPSPSPSPLPSPSPSPSPSPTPAPGPSTTGGAGPVGVGTNTERVVWSQQLDDEEVTGPLTFRLVQAVQKIDINQPASITNATQITEGGATLTINVPTDPEAADSLSFSLKDPQAGIDNVALTPDEIAPVLRATLPDGRNFAILIDSVDRSTAGLGENLSWMVYGSWNLATPGSGINTTSYYVAGTETPDANMPTTGTATFNGFVQGNVAKPEGSDLKVATLQGDATITADFAAGTITGAAPGITAVPLGTLPLTSPLASGPPEAWNGLTFDGTFTSGLNGFVGSTAVSSAPGNEYSLGSGADGSFAGLFYGPAADVLGAVWNIADGTGTATGVLVGKQ